VKYLDEFRDLSLAKRLVAEIRRIATNRWTIMEVCGGQTHSILRHGIDVELQDVVELIHGPGCPVCVTSVNAIDFAQRLSQQPDVILTTFGDMLRVSGSRGTLMETRSSGGNVRSVYSPMDAVRLASENPHLHVVFFAVGFETTAPATALAVRQAEQQGLENFSVLSAHVRVLPAMTLIASSPDCRIQAFLAAGHVCTVTGYERYQSFATRFAMPVVVTGFEPVDLLEGIRACVESLQMRSPVAINAYSRMTHIQGNLAAQQIVDSVYQKCDRIWRGFGLIRDGGFCIREKYHRFDAERRFKHLSINLSVLSEPNSECRCGEVLSGKIKPTQCDAFASRCSPDAPLGAPMVSSEGACAAYYRYVMHQPTPVASQLTKQDQ
jgi:hydrogenase expression/formation protein HypD